MQRDNDTWVSELRAGDESALADLRSTLLRNARKALSKYSRADDAFLEDTVQDAVLRTLDRLDQFEGRSQFVTWATAIAVRVALSELRRKRWRDISLDSLVADADVVPEQAIDRQLSPSVQLEQQALYGAVRDVIERLSPKQRAALLAELKGMPQDEIARQLNSNRNAVYKLTHDARKNLKKGLEAMGYGMAEVMGTLSTLRP